MENAAPGLDVLYESAVHEQTTERLKQALHDNTPFETLDEVRALVHATLGAINRWVVLCSVRVPWLAAAAVNG